MMSAMKNIKYVNGILSDKEIVTLDQINGSLNPLERCDSSAKVWGMSRYVVRAIVLEVSTSL